MGLLSRLRGKCEEPVDFHSVVGSMVGGFVSNAEPDPTGNHSNTNVGLRTGNWMFFPTRDPGSYVGRHRA